MKFPPVAPKPWQRGAGRVQAVALAWKEVSASSGHREKPCTREESKHQFQTRLQERSGGEQDNDGEDVKGQMCSQ